MGKAEVPEGVRAVAARHRSESTSMNQGRLENVAAFFRVHVHHVTHVFQEEYEDSSGNVVNKKTYEDLKRQGLL